MFVTVLHNTATDPEGRSLGWTGWQPTHALGWVFTLRLPDTAWDAAAAERVYDLLNVGDDPNYGTPDPQAVAYRALGLRSLSVGDVLVADGKALAVAKFGFTEVPVEDLSYTRGALAAH